MSLDRIANQAIETIGTYGHLRTTPTQAHPLMAAQLSACAADHQLETFALWCYAQDDNGLWLAIFPNGMIRPKVFTPWGSSGQSGMSRTHRDVLALWLREKRARPYFAPWHYHAEENRWYVDLMRYPNQSAALGWLKNNKINPQDWRRIQERVLMRRGRRVV